MPFPWQRMTVDECADFERLLGGGIVHLNGMYWIRVRPFFYRPLLSFQECQPDSVQPPPMAWLGGFQHAVPPGEPGNSCLNLLMFKDAETYTVDRLDYNRKRQVKQAAKQFVIRPISDKEEFRQKAFPVYLSFYERTRYPYGAQRRNPEYFSQWTDALFNLPKIAILGGYRDGQLGGVSVSLLVENTVSYKTFFCDTGSLRLGLSDLMLHFVRETAARDSSVKQIFTGLYKGGKGVDDFYLLRGCTLVGKPAQLHLNPLTRLFLKRFLPKQYAHLKGDNLWDGQAVKPGSPLQKLERQAVPDERKAIKLDGDGAIAL